METRPRTVKELLVEGKDVSELMVDLAYAAVFFGDHLVADEVFRLEETMDRVLVDIRTMCLVAARTQEDARQLAGVLGLADSIEDIANSAEEIAEVVRHRIGVPPELLEDLRKAEEVVTRVTVEGGSELAGRTLAETALPTRTGMWVIGLRRDSEWRFGPEGDQEVREGDVLFLQGPPDGVPGVRELASAAGAPTPGSPPPEPPASPAAEPSADEPPPELGESPAEPPTEPPAEDPGKGPTEPAQLPNLDRAVDLVVELKNTSEVAVGLAYSAILLQDRRLAGEVAAIEETSDALYHDLELWVLRAAKDTSDPQRLRGLLHISAASERIVDAARSMTRLIEGDEPPHLIVAQAFAETAEIPVEALVANDAEAAGRTLGELHLQTETGMEVLAIQRGSRWIYRPRSTRSLQPNDRILALGPEEGTEKLREMCGDPRPPDDRGWYAPTESH